jgi:hypothetical protein
LILIKQMITQKEEPFKYHDCLITAWQKTIKGFVMIYLVNVIVMRDQVLEEEIGRDSIARKTIQYRQCLDRIT